MKDDIGLPTSRQDAVVPESSFYSSSDEDERMNTPSGNNDEGNKTPSSSQTSSNSDDSLGESVSSSCKEKSAVVSNILAKFAATKLQELRARGGTISTTTTTTTSLTSLKDRLVTDRRSFRSRPRENVNNVTRTNSPRRSSSVPNRMGCSRLTSAKPLASTTSVTSNLRNAAATDSSDSNFSEDDTDVINTAFAKTGEDGVNNSGSGGESDVAANTYGDNKAAQLKGPDGSVQQLHKRRLLSDVEEVLERSQLPQYSDNEDPLIDDVLVTPIKVLGQRGRQVRTPRVNTPLVARVVGEECSHSLAASASFIAADSDDADIGNGNNEQEASIDQKADQQECNYHADVSGNNSSSSSNWTTTTSDGQTVLEVNAEREKKEDAAAEAKPSSMPYRSKWTPPHYNAGRRSFPPDYPQPYPYMPAFLRYGPYGPPPPPPPPPDFMLGFRGGRGRLDYRGSRPFNPFFPPVPHGARYYHGYRGRPPFRGFARGRGRGRYWEMPHRSWERDRERESRLHERERREMERAAAMDGPISSSQSDLGFTRGRTLYRVNYSQEAMRRHQSAPAVEHEVMSPSSNIRLRLRHRSASRCARLVREEDGLDYRAAPDQSSSQERRKRHVQRSSSPSYERRSHYAHPADCYYGSVTPPRLRRPYDNRVPRYELQTYGRYDGPPTPDRYQHVRYYAYRGGYTPPRRYHSRQSQHYAGLPPLPPPRHHFSDRVSYSSGYSSYHDAPYSPGWAERQQSPGARYKYAWHARRDECLSPRDKLLGHHYVTQAGHEVVVRHQRDPYVSRTNQDPMDKYVHGQLYAARAEQVAERGREKFSTMQYHSDTASEKRSAESFDPEAGDSARDQYTAEPSEPPVTEEEHDESRPDAIDRILNSDLRPEEINRELTKFVNEQRAQRKYGRRRIDFELHEQVPSHASHDSNCKTSSESGSYKSQDDILSAASSVRSEPVQHNAIAASDNSPPADVENPAEQNQGNNPQQASRGRKRNGRCKQAHNRFQHQNRTERRYHVHMGQSAPLNPLSQPFVSQRDLYQLYLQNIQFAQGSLEAPFTEIQQQGQQYNHNGNVYEPQPCVDQQGNVIGVQQQAAHYTTKAQGSQNEQQWPGYGYDGNIAQPPGYSQMGADPGVAGHTQGVSEQYINKPPAGQSTDQQYPSQNVLTPVYPMMMRGGQGPMGLASPMFQPGTPFLPPFTPGYSPHMHNSVFQFPPPGSPGMPWIPPPMVAPSPAMFSPHYHNPHVHQVKASGVADSSSSQQYDGYTVTPSTPAV